MHQLFCIWRHAIDSPLFAWPYLIWFDFCFTSFQHILGHFGCCQLPWPNCSWASLLGSLPVLSAHPFASNWQLLFLNQWKRENGCWNFFMTKSPRKTVPDVGIELGGRLHAKWTRFRSSYRARLFDLIWAMSYEKRCSKVLLVNLLMHLDSHSVRPEVFLFARSSGDEEVKWRHCKRMMK